MSHVNDLMVPTIHLNGSSPTNLRDANRLVGDALRQLAELMVDAEPNSRDYYLQGDGAYNRARSEHVARLDMVRRLRLEYTYIVEKIDEQLTARKR